MSRLLVVALALALAGCNQQQRPQSYNFADEDACEAAGMSDAFCDEMFPEIEDFFPAKTKKPKAVARKPAKSSWTSRVRSKVTSSRRR